MKDVKSWGTFDITFLCAFVNIITLISSFKENCVMGYEYVNEKTRKEWWSTYEEGEPLCDSECWPERYFEE